MAAYLHSVLFGYSGSHHVSDRTSPEIVEMPYPNPGIFASLFPDLELLKPFTERQSPMRFKPPHRERLQGAANSRPGVACGLLRSWKNSRGLPGMARVAYATPRKSLPRTCADQAAVSSMVCDHHTDGQSRCRACRAKRLLRSKLAQIIVRNPRTSLALSGF
jgi:hypothetical protein